jgi:uncharacterized protein YutE (UPF0331/DUF86 family)
MLDVASHIVSDEHLGEPETNKQLFERLATARWVSEGQRKVFVAMAGFCNLLVHGYAAVDPSIVRDIVEHRLDSLIDFVTAIRVRMAGHRLA